MNKYIFLITLLAFCLSGCATSYKSAGITGGYTEENQSPNIAKISFRGNAFTTSTRTYQFAMKRAAEITLQRGYRYFEVIEKHNLMQQQTMTTGTIMASNGFPLSIVKIHMLDKKTDKSYDAKTTFTKIKG